MPLHSDTCGTWYLELTHPSPSSKECKLTVLIQYFHSGLTYWLSGDLTIARDGDREGLFLFSDDIIQYWDQHRQTCSAKVKGQGFFGRSEVYICCGIHADMAGSSRDQKCAVCCLPVAESEEVTKEKDREISVCPVSCIVALTEPSSSAMV